MKTPLLIFTLLTLTLTAHARLGETFDQLSARYGEGSVLTATNDDSFIAHFQHNGYTIAVTFWKGECAEESLSSYDAVGNPNMIFQDDGDRLFRDISGDGKIAIERSGQTSTYKNKTTGATGTLRTESLTVFTKAWLDHCGAEFKEKHGTQGF